jgi:hypothetical protein
MAAARRQSQAPSSIPLKNQLCLFANGPVSLYSQMLINDGSRYRRPPSTPKHRDRRASANQALQPRFADAHSGFDGKNVCHSNGNRSHPRSRCRQNPDVPVARCDEMRSEGLQAPVRCTRARSCRGDQGWKKTPGVGSVAGDKRLPERSPLSVRSEAPRQPRRPHMQPERLRADGALLLEAIPGKV